MSASNFLHDLIAGAASETGDETHARIVDAAYELFLAFGLRRTSIEDIARRAGIGRPTLYRRFADKDAIVQAIFVRESRKLVTEVGAKVANIEDPAELLTRAFVVATRTVATHPLTRRLLETEPELLLPYMTLNAGPLIDLGHVLTAPYANKLEEQGSFPDLDVDYLLEMLARLFISVVLTPSHLVDAASEPKLEKLVGQLLRPLSPRPRPRPRKRRE